MNQKNSMKITGVSLLLMAVLAIVGMANAETNKSIAVITLSGVMLLDFIVSWSLYELLKNTNKTLSLATAVFRIVYTVLMSINIYRFASGLEYEIFMRNFGIFLIIFSFHLLLLGLNLLRANFISKIYGYLAILAFLAYFLDNIGILIPHDYMRIVTVISILPAMLGELPLAIWLTIKGFKTITN